MIYYKLIADAEHPEGIKVEMTSEEVAELTEPVTVEPTTEERILALEEAVNEIAEIVR